MNNNMTPREQEKAENIITRFEYGDYTGKPMSRAKAKREAVEHIETILLHGPGTHSQFDHAYWQSVKQHIQSLQ